MGAMANVSGFRADRAVWEPRLRFFKHFNSGDKTPGSRHPRGWKGTGISGGQPEDGTTVDSNFYPAGRDNFVDPDHRDRQDLPWFPDAALMDTVAHLQRDLNDMRAECRYLRTPGGQPPHY